MGSTGSGNFTDYSNTRPSDGGTQTGGSSGRDKCDIAISAILEDVERCSFYRKNKMPPVLKLPVNLKHSTRLEVVDANLDVIGYLPTKYNYLAVCMNAGYSYSGFVSDVSSKGILIVKVDLAPQQD